MAALCVCSGDSLSKFYSIRSKKCALYEIESIIQSLVNLNPVKRRNICTRSTDTSGERFKKNIYYSVKAREVAIEIDLATSHGR